MKNKFIYSAMVLLLSAFLLFSLWQLFTMQQNPTLPLSQEAAAQIGGKILKKSYPALFDKRVAGHKIHMKIGVDDEGSYWNVYNYHETKLIEAADGRKLWASQYSHYVDIDKETGEVIRFGIYE